MGTKFSRLNPLSEMDLKFLYAMAEDNTVSKVGDVESRMGTSHGTFQTYRRRLLDAGIITSPRRGELKFVMPQLGDYLRGQNSGTE